MSRERNNSVKVCERIDAQADKNRRAELLKSEA
jgi:hypothetical protein